MNEQEASLMKDHLIIYLLNQLGGTVEVKFDELNSNGMGEMTVFVNQKQQTLIFTTKGSEQ